MITMECQYTHMGPFVYSFFMNRNNGPVLCEMETSKLHCHRWLYAAIKLSVHLLLCLSSLSSE